jgi:hypothetical protein
MQSIKYIIIITGVISSIYLGVNLLDIFNVTDLTINSDIDEISNEEVKTNDGTVSDLSDEVSQNTIIQEEYPTVREITYANKITQTELKSSDIKSSIEQLDDEIHFIENLQEDPDLYGITENSPTTESSLSRHSSPDDRVDIVNKDRANKFDRIYVRK